MNKNFIRILIYIAITILLVVSCFLIIRLNDIKVIKIVGHSMYPTLVENNFVVTTKFNELERGDIIMFRYEQHQMIKRIIGVPGDTISITEDGQIFVNETLLKEDYIRQHDDFNPGELYYPITIPEGEYFVLGDNRDDSLDSRIISVGNVPEKEIVGKVQFILYPPATLK